MISVKIDGLDAVQASLAGLGKQVRFAGAKALTQTAYVAREDLKKELAGKIQGGAAPYTLRAFNVEFATRDTLTARVYLREDGPPGGTPYTKAIGHLFTGGNRRWKRLEGWLRGKNIIPAGHMIAPGAAAPLDGRGNFRAPALKEMLTVLASETRNLQVMRGTAKQRKAIGFFVARPGDKSGLPPGIWRRIVTGKSSTVEPWINFVKPTRYDQKFDLKKTGERTVDRVFQANFDRALADALRTAR